MSPDPEAERQSNTFIKTFENFRFPLFLFLLTILTYGIFSLRLGFYLDDWYIILFKQKFGPEGFWLYFSEDRPLESLPYVIFFSIFNDSPVLWALFALFMRWIFGVVFWMVLNHFFPSQRKLWIWSVVVFTVFPGFKFHNFSIMFSIFYTFFSCHLLSFLGMGKAIDNRGKPKNFWLWTLLSMIFVVIGIVPVEYYVGVELFRPILLWIIHARTYPRQPRKVIKWIILDWLPYFLVLITFLGFRISQRNAYSYEISLLDKIKATPLSALAVIVKNAVLSLTDGLFMSWFDAARVAKHEIIVTRNYPFMILLFVSLIFLSAGLLYLLKNEKIKQQFENHSWILMLLGVLLSSVSLIPFYAGGFEVSVDFPWNRFFLAMLPGISLFTAGALDYFLRTDKIKILFLTVLGVLAIGSHFMVGTEFIQQWNRQVDLMQQLSWRAPALKNGTTLMTADSTIAKYFSGSALTGPVNLIYDPLNTEEKYNFFVVLMDSNQADAIPKLETINDFSLTLRSIEFIGNTESILTYLLPEKGCLQVLSDGIVPDVSGLQFDHKNWQALARASNLDLILTKPDQPVSLPVRYFGEENTQQWCYFYEKADLARQSGDWQGVMEYYQEAQLQGFSPINGSEYRILVEAWLKSGIADNPNTLKEQLSLQYPDIGDNWCTVTKELLSSDNLPQNDRAILTNLNIQGGCSN